MHPTLRRLFSGPAAAILAAGTAIGPAAACKHEYRPYVAPESEQVWELGGAKVWIEVAKDRASREQGLMNRASLPDDQGMIFVYPEPRVLRFWMRNTAIPLSIAFLEELPEGRVRVANIEDMEPFVESPGYVSRQRVRFALEMNRGWFAAHGVRAGDELEMPEWIRDLVASGDE
jgi:uncharacterized membrane protein (UPF0127 family)